MARYDRQYDFGLRGYRQTTHPMIDHRFGRNAYDAGYRPGFDERAFPEQRLSNRVTARYNRDYVTGYSPEERYDRNFTPYGGDHPDRVGDHRFMRRPFFTHAGTRTMRGGSMPIEYDYPDYRRYPDGI